jgi:drug/metabolite transporter (DMT)-like permease
MNFTVVYLTSLMANQYESITAAFVARFVEQLFGSPTAGGVLIFWILIGGLAAMLMKPRARLSKQHGAKTSSSFTQYSSYIAVGIITIGSVILAWDKGVNYLIANQIASFQYRPTVVTIEDAIDPLEQTADHAPDVPRYWNDLAELEHGRAGATDNPQRKA